jgi:multidrug efflux pump subunit AcrA (membrane-fusion protein)
MAAAWFISGPLVAAPSRCLFEVLDCSDPNVTRAVFPNPDRYLTPGMFVRVRLIGKGKYTGPLINDRAIATDQDRRFVLVVGEGDKVEYRAVVTGPMFDGLRVVRSGVKPGERIVVNGLQRTQPGMVVKPRIVPMEGEPAAAAR